MLYISKRKNKNRDITDEYMARYLAQFSDERRIEIIGIAFFNSDLFGLMHETLDKEISSKHLDVMSRASSIIGYLAEDFIDNMTELYTYEDATGRETALSTEDLFITGYRNALFYLTETTDKILKSKVFKGSENSIAKQFYMAVGIELADKLKNIMEDTSLIPITETAPGTLLS